MEGNAMTRKQAKRVHYRYAPCARGRYRNPSSRTADLASVTCGACKLRVAKLDLRPRTNYPDVPTFEVRSEGRFRTFGGDWGTHLVFRCPVCGKENRHGGTFGKPGDGDGHRVAHCDCWEHGYVIREVTAL